MKTKINFKQSILAGLWAAITAAIINAVLFYIFHAAGIISDSIYIMPETSLGVMPIIISSIVPTLIASMVFFLIEKFTKNGFKIFAGISVLLLALSFIRPFTGIPGVTVGYALVLNLMHIAVVLALLYYIGKTNKINSSNN